MNVENEIDPSQTGFVKPLPEFKGNTLAPFRLGRRVLLAQATLAEDGARNSGARLSLALIYLLSLPDKEATRIAFNRAEFREKALAWFEKTGAEPEEAISAAREILGEPETNASH